MLQVCASVTVLDYNKKNDTLLIPAGVLILPTTAVMYETVYQTVINKFKIQPTRN